MLGLIGAIVGVSAVVINLVAFTHALPGTPGRRLGPGKAFLVAGTVLLLQALSTARAAGADLSALPAEPSDATALHVRFQAAAPAAALTQSPLVMRMSKDEFRIAFGIQGIRCAPSGCHGAIRYRVKWTTEDGTAYWGIREVGYTVDPHTARTITVDRQYFDTSEGAHTTDVVQVMVVHITCLGGKEQPD